MLNRKLTLEKLENLKNQKTSIYFIVSIKRFAPAAFTVPDLFGSFSVPIFIRRLLTLFKKNRHDKSSVDDIMEWQKTNEMANAAGLYLK